MLLELEDESYTGVFLQCCLRDILLQHIHYLYSVHIRPNIKYTISYTVLVVINNYSDDDNDDDDNSGVSWKSVKRGSAPPLALLTLTRPSFTHPGLFYYPKQRQLVCKALRSNPRR